MNWFLGKKYKKRCKKNLVFDGGKYINPVFISTPRCVILELFSLLRLMGSEYLRFSSFRVSKMLVENLKLTVNILFT